MITLLLLVLSSNKNTIVVFTIVLFLGDFSLFLNIDVFTDKNFNDT